MSSLHPFRPVDPGVDRLESFDLNGLGARLVRERQYQEEGRSGITLARDAHVSVVLAAIRKGTELREHRAPASALVTLLSGKAAFLTDAGAKQTEMLPGTLVAFGADLDHALVAEEDSTCLIVIGGRSGRG